METQLKVNVAMFALFTMIYGLMLLYYYTYPENQTFFFFGCTITAWLCGLVFKDMMKEIGLGK